MGEEVEITKLPTYSCKRCGHSWYPRKDRIPTICPKCKSRLWYEKRGEKKK